MEGPGKLNDLLGSHKSENSNPQLDWAAIAPAVNDAMTNQKKKKKRKAVLWWLSGSALILIPLCYILLQLPVSEKLAATYTANNSVRAEDYVTVESAETTTPTYNVETTSQSTPATQLDRLKGSAPVATETTVIDATDVQDSDSRPTKEIKTIAEQASVYLPASNTKLLGTAGYTTASGTDNIAADLPPADDSKTTPSGPSAANMVIAQEIPRVNPLLVSTIPALSPHVAIIPSSQISTISSRSMKLHQYGGVMFSNVASLYSNATPLTGVNMESAITKQIRGAWVVSTGVRMQQLRFQTAFIDRTPIQVYSPMTADTIYRFAGGEENIVYTDSIAGTGTRSYGYTNKLTSISIPLSVGYMIDVGGITVTPQLGVALSMYEKQRFNIADEMYALTAVNVSNSWSLKPTYHAALGIDIPITHSIGIGTRYIVTRESLARAEGSSAIISHGLQAAIYYKW